MTASGDNRRLYKWLKLLETAVAASLPVVAAVHRPVWVTGGLAAVIVVLEGVQQDCASCRNYGSLLPCMAWRLPALAPRTR